MRKRIIGTEQPTAQQPAVAWLDLEGLAAAELTSEHPEYPFETALRGEAPGWRAAGPGPQTIRLFFDTPQTIRQIRLVFREMEHQRTQEFVLRWSADGGQHFSDVVRQQYNLNPPAEEIEAYHVDLNGVTVLALELTPDISGGPAPASLAALLVG